MDKKKPIPIGAKNFKEIIEGDFYYVDKTKLIKEILDNFMGTKLYLRPRRFGKTINMYMLRDFFDITKKEENQKLFEGLYIYNLPEYMQYQGKYPVIFISLKDTTADTWEQMYEKLKSIISKIYEEQKNIRNILEDYQFEKYNEIMKGIASEVDYQNSLKFLTNCLHQYYNQEVIVLIDEYDAPLNKAHAKGFLDKAIGFIRSFLSAGLKDNEYLKIAVLTGVLRMSQQSVFSELNHFKSYSVVSPISGEYFGFTKQEVRELLKYYEMEHKYEQIVKWYDGYYFNCEEQEINEDGTAKQEIEKLEIFNPWSILNCIYEKGITKPYWVNTGNTNLLSLASEGVTAKIVEIIDNLLKGQSFSIKLDEKTVYEELKSNCNAFLNTMLFTGYLTVDVLYQKDNRQYVKLRIPNLETRQVVEDMQARWYPMFSHNELVQAVCQAIIENNEDEFKNNLSDLLIGEISYFVNSEAFYAGLFYMLMTYMPKEYIREAELESGYGRADYVMYNKNLSKGYIFELKECEEEEEMEKTCNAGMEQIHNRKYGAKLVNKGVEEIWLYSLTFCKKQVYIKKELYTK